jgi:hypothetical protein
MEKLSEKLHAILTREGSWDHVQAMEMVHFIEDHSAAILAALRSAEGAPTRLFALYQRVEKKFGSSWQGRVVGFYSTALTPVGYAVESEREPGAVQIFPEAALQSMEGK